MTEWVGRVMLRAIPAIDLTIAGAPQGKGRPRFVRQTGRAYTPPETERAQQRIQQEWILAGRPYLQGPLYMEIEAVLHRPQTHWKKNGSLGIQGQRNPWPIRKPDLDNALKLCADAISGLAFRDDSQIVEARIWKRWAQSDELAQTRIRVWPLGDTEQTTYQRSPYMETQAPERPEQDDQNQEPQQAPTTGPRPDQAGPQGDPETATNGDDQGSDGDNE